MSRDCSGDVHEKAPSAEQDKYFLRKTTSFLFSEKTEKIKTYNLPLHRLHLSTSAPTPLPLSVWNTYSGTLGMLIVFSHMYRQTLMLLNFTPQFRSAVRT